MFQTFFTSSSETYKKISVEEMQTILKTPAKYIIIHTLTSEYQDYVIPGTVQDTREESVINEMLTRIDIPDKPIVIYGKNARDETPETKAKQLKSLGIHDISVYSGGMFEWLLLNEVYGSDEFPIKVQTDQTIMHDIWKYR
jgi:rhodanese-related sulfurtransferase